MKHLVRGMLSLLVLGIFASHIERVLAQSPADEASVRAIPQAFAAGWAKHDGHQVAQLMADDVDFVNVGAGWTHGRADFDLYTTRLLSGRFKESVLTPRDTAVRFLRPDLALLHWSWSLTGDRNEDLTPRKPRFGLFTMVVEKHGNAWLIVAAQNANFMPGPNPEMNGITPPMDFPNPTEKP